MYKLGQHHLKNRKNQMNNISMNFNHETHEQQLTCSEELLQQLHKQVQHQQQELQWLRQQNNCNHQSQPLQDSYTNAGTVSNEKQNIVIFGDSIPKDIHRVILGQKFLMLSFL